MTLAEQNDVVRELVRDQPPEARVRSQRAAVYAVAGGERLGMTDEELRDLRFAAELWEVPAGGYPFLASAERLIRERHPLLTAAFAVASGLPDPDWDSILALGYDAEMVAALRAVAPLIQPIGT